MKHTTGCGDHGSTSDTSIRAVIVQPRVPSLTLAYFFFLAHSLYLSHSPAPTHTCAQFLALLIRPLKKNVSFKIASACEDQDGGPRRGIYLEEQSGCLTGRVPRTLIGERRRRSLAESRIRPFIPSSDSDHSRVMNQLEEWRVWR